ncbi:MAG: EthD family reductase [Shimia thalassica]|uniref:EthD family reductase n=1 Tax=Shimia thalassica TaxID=1715693 RepID=UPI000C087505|nr:EthD family reductase [Shimia thalassica]MDO6485996.1 EthD family reductase [Shimia thalassica]MDP2520832.1 EthD family reductase [Shimia thalassica]PHO02146.1 ethyl tert-butyl ether degradation protein EthD [Rhodobacteraceae bacterium 4F10]
MPVSLQVAYPVSEDSTFDLDYYLSTHMALVGKHMGPYIESTLVTKGLAGGPNVPAPFHAIATIVFKDQDALNSALGDSADVLADIPNFTNSKPQMLIGEVMG